MAKEAATILGRHDQPVDPTLDLESNAEEHSARHNLVLGKWEGAVRAVAVGVVQRGDKLPPEVALATNSGTIFDLREEGGSDKNPGADAIDEVKCASPTTVTAPSGAHLHQHGATAPKLLESILGVKARGDQGCGRFNPRTNKGHRRGTLGKYHDALHVKRHLVTPVIVETTGAIHHMAIHRLHVLKRRARGAPKNDRTRYGRSPLSTRSFVAHHSQQISKAAVLGDANEVLKAIHKLKRRAYLCAASAPAVAGGARA